MHLPRPGLVAAGFCLFLALLLTLGPQLQRAFDPNLTVLRSLLLKAGVGPEYEADEALEAYAQTVASSAYLYATSVIEMAIAEHTQTSGYASDVNATHGVFAHFEGGKLPSFQNSWLSGANPDALFSSCWLLLHPKPVILIVPPVPEDLPWFSIQIEDFYGRNVGYVSTRSLEQQGGSQALKGGGRYLLEYSPNCREQIQRFSAKTDEFHGRICVGTKRAWVLVRIAASATTAAKYHATFQQYLRVEEIGVSDGPKKAEGNAEQLHGYAAPTSQESVVSLMSGIPGADQKHFKRFASIDKMEASIRGSVEALLLFRAFLIENNPANPVCYDQPLQKDAECEDFRDDGLMHDLVDVGLDPRLDTPMPLENVHPRVLAGLRKGAKLGDRISRRNRMNIQKIRHFKLQGGWAISPKELGRYHDDYFLRSMAKRNGIGANNPEEAVYPTAFFDQNEYLLDGNNVYSIRFNVSEMNAAARTFWSLTAYDRGTGKLMNHPFSVEHDQYSISTLKGLQASKEGAIEVRVQFDQPTEVATTNWLPVLRRGIYLICRLYGPTENALHHEVRMPPIERISIG